MRNPEEERNQFIQLYSNMTDEQLLDLAFEADELTEVAREAFNAEMAKRGLEMPQPALPPTADFEHRKLVTIRHFRDLPEALLAKGALESTGIEAFLGDDNMVRLDWFISNGIGGIRLMVDPEHAEAANETLGQEIPDKFGVEGVGEYEQPRCPKCNSLEVTFTGLNKPIAYTSAYFNIPLPVHSNAWKCEACGNQWTELPEPASERTE